MRRERTINYLKNNISDRCFKVWLEDGWTTNAVIIIRILLFVYTKFKNGWGNSSGHGPTPRFVGTKPVWTTFVSFQDMFNTHFNKACIV